jgi:hypothetical protein
LVPSHDSLKYVESTSLFVENGLSALGPYERFEIGIVVVEIVVDGRLRGV